jgi:hypothetical protein
VQDVNIRTTTTHEHLHLLLPVTLKHLISLVDDSELDALHGQDVGSGHEIHKTARRADEEVTASSKLLKVA